MHDGKTVSFKSYTHVFFMNFLTTDHMLFSLMFVALCIEGVGGLIWIFSTTLCLSIFSMIMIMFRAALYPVKLTSIPQTANEYDGKTEVVQYKQTSDEHADTAEPVIY